MKDDISELEQLLLREVLAQARLAADALIGEPNFSRAGRPPTRPALSLGPTSQAAKAAERGVSASREKSSEQVNREVVGEQIRLRGKVRALSVAKGNVGQKKEALKLPPNFTIPVARPKRLYNKDGATSFHFKYEAVSKTRSGKISASGTVTRKNAAKDHANYLERDSAVARSQKSDGGETEGDYAIISTSASLEALVATSSAVEGGRYIEREEALAHREDGEPVILSNISKDAEERQEFWALVEKHEPEPAPDKLEVTVAQAPEFWDAVRQDPSCPKSLAVEIAKADPHKKFVVTTNDNQAIRTMLSRHGWQPPASPVENEGEAEREARHEQDRSNARGARCIDGRGGRIQQRIVGELPYELSHTGRIRILERFAMEFEKRNLPYVAVMHAPDYANDEKNWHFHLAYYDRPCSRIPEDAADHDPANYEYDARTMAARKSALEEGTLKDVGGRWDFTVSYTRTKASREKVTTYPFTQKKRRECNRKDWPEKLRIAFAKITNEELAHAGVARRVDHRTFSEMGIEKEAEEHLGSRSAQMDAIGIATPRGVENEERQWRYEMASIDAATQHHLHRADGEASKMRIYLSNARINAERRTKIELQIERFERCHSFIAEQKAIAAELGAMIMRAKSRASKVKETCVRHLDAIAANRATKAQIRRKSLYKRRLEEAEEHLDGLTKYFGPEIYKKKEIEEKLAAFREETLHFQEEINNQILDASRWLLPKLQDLPKVSHPVAPARSISVGDRAGHTDRSVEQPPATDNPAQPFSAVAEPLPSTRQSERKDVPVGAASPQTTVHRKLDEIVRTGEAIIKSEEHDVVRYDLVDQARRALGSSAFAISEPEVQRRMGSIYAKQIQDITRLAAYARAKPDSFTIIANGPDGSGFNLRANSPPELIGLSRKFGRHPIAFMLVERARLEGYSLTGSVDSSLHDKADRDGVRPLKPKPIATPHKSPSTDALVEKRGGATTTPYSAGAGITKATANQKETRSSTPAIATGRRKGNVIDIEAYKLLRSYSHFSAESLAKLPADEREILAVAEAHPDAERFRAMIKSRESLRNEEAKTDIVATEEQNPPPVAGQIPDWADRTASYPVGESREEEASFAFTDFTAEERAEILRPRVLGRHRSAGQADPTGPAGTENRVGPLANGPSISGQSTPEKVAEGESPIPVARKANPAEEAEKMRRAALGRG